MDYALRLATQLRAHLRDLRKQQGLTQAELGARLGLSQVRIAEIEAKPGSVSVDQLMRILSALGATLILRNDLRPPGTPSATPTVIPKGTANASDPAANIIEPNKGAW